MATTETETKRERIIHGMGPEPVVETTPPIIKPGCGDGNHCAEHGSGPFFCCRCGAEFMPAPSPK